MRSLLTARRRRHLCGCRDGASCIASTTGGAHYTVIPEEPFDIAEICKAMERRFQMGEKYGIIVVAEGAVPKEGTMDAGLGDEMKKRLGYDVRTTVLGYLRRCARHPCSPRQQLRQLCGSSWRRH